MNSDFKELLKIFAHEKIRYLIIGGYAVAKHAEPHFYFPKLTPETLNQGVSRRSIVEFGSEKLIEWKRFLYYSNERQIDDRFQPLSRFGCFGNQFQIVCAASDCNIELVRVDNACKIFARLLTFVRFAQKVVILRKKNTI